MSNGQINGNQYITYNGVTLWWPHIIVNPQPEQSSSGRTLKYNIIEITVSAIMFMDDNSTKASTWTGLIQLLNTPGRTFTYIENGINIITAQPATGSGGITQPDVNGVFSDVAFGPIPTAKIVENLTYMARVVMTIRVTSAPFITTQYAGTYNGLPNAQTITEINISGPSIMGGGAGNFPIGSEIVDNVCSVENEIDTNGSLVRVIKGQMTITGKYGNWFNAAQAGPDAFRYAVLNQNRFLNRSILQPPPFCTRRYRFGCSEDGLTLAYMVIDEQQNWLPPFPATSWNGPRIAIVDTGKLQLGTVIKEVTCSFQLPYTTGQANNGAMVPGPALATPQDSVTKIVAQILAAYVYSDPSARVFIDHFEVVCEDQSKNVWSCHIIAQHQRSMLFSSALAQCGLFANPPRQESSYNWPTPYGTLGSYGTAYNQQVDSTGLGELNALSLESLKPTSGKGKIADNTAITQPYVAYHNERVRLYAGQKTTLFPALGGTLVGGKYTNHCPIITWKGYKIVFADSAAANKEADLLKTYIPTPATYFNVVTKFDATYVPQSANSPTPMTGFVSPPTGGQLGQNPTVAKWEAIVLYHAPENYTSIASRIGSINLYCIRYEFAVMLPPFANNYLGGANVDPNSANMASFTSLLPRPVPLHGNPDVFGVIAPPTYTGAADANLGNTIQTQTIVTTPTEPG